MLGSEKLEVRIGAMYALEGIAKDSLNYHWQIMEILIKFIEIKSPGTTSGPAEEDIKAAFKVITRRTKEQINFEKNSELRIVLRNANLNEVEVYCSPLRTSNC